MSHDRHDRSFDDPQLDLRERAIRRIQARRAFFGNLLVYVMVHAILVVVWANNGGFFWPIFSMAGWGIGLVLQAIGVFGPGTSEERIRREMRRLGD